MGILSSLFGPPATPASPATATLTPPAAAPDDFLACIPVILAAEGGFVNDPRDPGGVRAVAGRTELVRALWPVDGARPGTVGDVRAVRERGGPVPPGEIHGAVVDDLLARRHQAEAGQGGCEPQVKVG